MMLQLQRPDSNRHCYFIFVLPDLNYVAAHGKNGKEMANGRWSTSKGEYGAFIKQRGASLPSPDCGLSVMIRPNPLPDARFVLPMTLLYLKLRLMSRYYIAILLLFEDVENGDDVVNCVTASNGNIIVINSV